jgi:signal transduction histidine kinase
VLPFQRELVRWYSLLGAMVAVSTAITLLCLLGAYRFLVTEWRQYNVSLLQGERNEVQLLLEHAMTSSDYHPADLIDDSGEHLSFVAFQGSRTVLESESHPLPATLLTTTLTGPSVQELTYAGMPYRLYHYRWQGTYDIVIYQMITTEKRLLDRARIVLLTAGASGAALSTALGLALGWALITPVRKGIKEQREWLLELSHELQTPLAVARAGMSRGVSAHMRDLAVQAIEDASLLVRDIVYLSQLSTLPNPAPPEPVPVSDVTEEVVRKLTPWAEHRRILLSGSAEPGLFVATTTERWTRLVSLLAKNAIDHGAPGSTVTWELKEDGGRVVLRISNRLIMRGPDHLVKVRPGVGLTIAHRLVQEMRGKLEITQVEDTMVARVSVPKLRPRWRSQG